MRTIKETALAFFEACETGKGWDACSPLCQSGATFQSQAEPLADITSLSGYVDWMQGLLVALPDGRYEIRSVGLDAENASVVIYAVFKGTHTGAAGPSPATGKAAESDYVYAISFTGDKISGMTKIWNAPWALRQLGLGPGPGVPGVDGRRWPSGSHPLRYRWPSDDHQPGPPFTRPARVAEQ